MDPSLPGAPDKFLRGKATTLGEKYERFKDTIGLQMVDIARLELSSPDKVFFAQLLDRQNPVATRRSHVLLRSAYERIGRFVEGGEFAVFGVTELGGEIGGLLGGHHGP